MAEEKNNGSQSGEGGNTDLMQRAQSQENPPIFCCELARRTSERARYVRVCVRAGCTLVLLVGTRSACSQVQAVPGPARLNAS